MIILSAAVARTFCRRLTSIATVLRILLSGSPISHDSDMFVTKCIHVLLFFFSPAAVIREFLDVFEGQSPAFEAEFAAERV